MWVSGGSKWCSYVSVCTAVRAHSSMLVFTCKKGMKWEPERERERGFAIWVVCPCGLRFQTAEGWGNLLLSKIIGLLHPVISLIIMKASLQFSNHYSMPFLFLSNKEEHWCKTKCRDSISCLCLRAIQRWGMYTPSKYHPQYPTSDYVTDKPPQITHKPPYSMWACTVDCCHVQYFSESHMYSNYAIVTFRIYQLYQ